ncbi:MAG: alpha/beta hydrolase [Pseudomonadota bacterium]
MNGSASPETFSVPSGSALLAGERFSAGPPMVCLHAGVADRRMYAGQMPGLAGDFEVLAYDRRGFGETRTDDEPFRHVDDLTRLIEATGIDRPLLLGCSQGGRIAIDWALAHPGSVRGLILVSTAVSGAPIEPLPADIQPLEDALDAADEAGDLERVNAIEAHLWLDGPRSPEGRVTGPLRDLFLDMNGIALRHPPLTEEIGPPSAYDRLGELDMPALLIHGTLDYPHIVARHDELSGLIPNARTVACEGCAHLPPLESPDIVNAEILAFCRMQSLIP